MKVLLALDGSRYGELALRSVLDRVWPPKTKFEIVSIVEPMMLIGDPMMSMYEASAQEEFRDLALELVASAANRISDKFEDATVSTTVRCGSPAEAILQVADDWNPDLIVLGSHGRAGFKKLLLGSVSESVVRDAPCSVEVVKDSSMAARNTATSSEAALRTE